MPLLSTAMPDILWTWVKDSQVVCYNWCCQCTFLSPSGGNVQVTFCFHLESVQYTWNQLPQDWKHSPTLYHGLMLHWRLTALEQEEFHEHLQPNSMLLTSYGATLQSFQEKKENTQNLLKATQHPPLVIKLILHWKDIKHKAKTQYIA